MFLDGVVSCCSIVAGFVIYETVLEVTEAFFVGHVRIGFGNL